MSENKYHTLFVYGTLMNGYNNHRLLNDAVYLGDASTSGTMYSLGGFPCVSIEQQGTIIGEVYQIDDATLARCDLLEGYRGEGSNNFYERSLVQTTLGEAFIYHIEGSIYQRMPIKSGSWKDLSSEREASPS